ncbi:DUF503 domain-containing protein [Pontibacillus salicampi]|uniref:DUF503 domain-containing protein n=1 Tax=Pontibacillus salicampi TaxID=1449801 RepID=A0ABV6LP73_9BACI
MIGYLEVECFLYDAQSLKEKRSVIKRIVTRAQNEINVSVSELDHQNLWQRSLLGFVAISSDKVQTERELQRVVRLIDSFPEIERATTNIEWL